MFSATAAAEILMDAGSDLSDLESDHDEDDNVGSFIVPNVADISDSDSESSDDSLPPPPPPANVWKSSITQQSLNSFLGEHGLSSHACVSNDDSPLEYFRLIFTDELLTLVVEETNRYAAQYLQKTPLSSKSRAHNWKPVDAEELSLFLGLTLLTGIVHKRGKLESYWSKNSMIETPFFGKSMSRNRYQAITGFLHFNDNEKLAENNDNDKLYKVRPVYDLIVARWKAL
uniref:piggyBac transposable element-derived protein 4-like n=1 Tax=Ciona intestinalis TaxID=7719 RepID=UPI0005216805|nr:piggyBac transposable element-derived protein 4-like [Ciona intestinalis]|eukprot:XP_009859952.1 piggyBac transposable element-derived protein 4-like [Ciona intestinalis]